MKILNNLLTTVVLVLLLVGCDNKPSSERLKGTYVLTEGSLDGRPFTAGKDNIWATLQFHDGGRYSGEWHIGDDDPPFDGGWFLDGDSIRFSGPLDELMGHQDKKGLIHLIQVLRNTSGLAIESRVPVLAIGEADPRTPEQKMLDSIADANARLEALKRLEENRSRFVFRRSEQ